jgi:hypothetical protein
VGIRPEAKTFFHGHGAWHGKTVAGDQQAEAQRVLDLVDELAGAVRSTQETASEPAWVLPDIPYPPP